MDDKEIVLSDLLSQSEGALDSRDSPMVTVRERKSSFVRLFDKTAPGVCCPHFYELILSNGCPYDCKYCYLKLTFRGRKGPVLFNNAWANVEKELRLIPGGLFSTGELADSLAVTPPLLHQALDYFESQRNQFLMLLTKSSNITPLLMRRSSPQVIVSFSVNSLPAWKAFEIGTPGPDKRLAAARELMEKGWRIRFRIDPIILQTKLKYYETICKSIAAMKPEMITIGTLRQFAGLSRFSKDAPRQGLRMSDDGRLRYPSEVRKNTYLQIADWLGFQPALCKETKDLWNSLGWEFTGCNCTI